MTEISGAHPTGPAPLRRGTGRPDPRGDADPEVHRVLTEKVFPRQADVTTIDAWISDLA
ncbi:hypothetical protein ACIQ6K_37800 [Streptomyces sp. NPDC096354]|uniref:hypothetical protein n=1 Tax=Streptomyces sp. NPDC096354 TaxID=3366088 RepID=UPI0038044A9C